MNNHLLKLSINADFIEFVLIFSIIYSCLLLLFDILFATKFSGLYILLQLIYSILNSISLLIVFGLLIYFLGDIGVVTFVVSFIIFVISAFWKL
jgi:hypothetical protein